MSWWTLVWVFLVLALLVVPLLCALWVLREVLRAGKRVSVALSQLVPDTVQESEDAADASGVESWVPGAAASNWQRAVWQCERHFLRRARADRKVSRANVALRRWSRLGFLDGVSGPIEAELKVRVEPRVGHG